MKRILLKSIAAAAFATMLVSCLPNEEYLFSDTGMCTVLGLNKLQSDTGNIYHVTQNTTGLDIPDTLKRVMVSCDAMTAVAGKQNEYNIRLLQFLAAFYKTPLLKSTLDEEAVGNDGINIDQAWVSGGYLNAHIEIALLSPSKVDHTFNLVFNDQKSNSDTLYFEMRHNARGECPDNLEYNPAAFVIGGAYASFPLTGILQEGQTPICHFDWVWYEGDDYNVTRTKINKSGNIPTKSN